MEFKLEIFSSSTVNVWNPNLNGFQTLNHCSFQTVGILNIVWNPNPKFSFQTLFSKCVWNPNSQQFGFHTSLDLRQVRISDIYCVRFGQSQNSHQLKMWKKNSFRFGIAAQILTGVVAPDTSGVKDVFFTNVVQKKIPTKVQREGKTRKVIVEAR